MKNKILRLTRYLMLCALVLGVSAPLTRATGQSNPPIFLPVIFAVGSDDNPNPAGLVIDHRNTDISKIPDYWIEQAKKLTIHYAHTSHGSQVLDGLRWLEGRNAKYNVAINISSTVSLPADTTALRIYDGNNYGGNNYITPEMYWESSDGISHTRSVLTTRLFDVSLWTWCGQMSSYSDSQVNAYLNTMSAFGSQYPDVQMILYTGHTDGSAPGSKLWNNNNKVRDYAAQNTGTVLFDFADIESYDPAGNFYPTVSDSCSWCTKWCTDHPNNFECQNIPSGCAHTNGLQCTLKGQAYWWMLARLAGWDGTSQ